MNTALSNKLPDLVIRASAGSGKTFQLTNRYLALLHADVQAPHILATTFTRKAAGEILSRTLERLAHAATSQEACQELGDHIGESNLTRTRCLELLQRLVHELHQIRISTLDSFFAQAAGTHSLELGLPPGWQIVDELVDQWLRRRAIENVLRNEALPEISRLMNLINQGHAERSVSDTIRDVVKNLYNLFLETDAQAWDKIPRPAKLSEHELAQAIEILAQSPLPDDKRFSSAREKNLENAHGQRWEEFIASGLASKVLLGESSYQSKEIPQPTISAYQTLIEHARGELLGQLANQTQGTYQLLEKFHHEYENLKQEQGALRFDDVTRRLQSLLKKTPHQSLAFRMDGHIEHLLLDEFQDTSLQQWDVLKPIATTITQNNKGSFFCVGDVKQAIYGWRGGVAEVFEAVQNEIADLQELQLAKSYRSSPVVMEAVNQLFTGLENHSNLDDLVGPIRSWCEQFTPHETTRVDLSGHVTLETAPYSKKNQQDTILQFAAGRIAQIAKQSPEKTIGVLVRRNTAVGKLIFLLNQLQIPASEEGGNPLSDSAAVDLILSLLQLADHPGNSVAWFHVANSPLGVALGLAQDATDEQKAIWSRDIRAQLLDEGYGPSIYGWAQILVTCSSRREASRLKHFVELAYSYEASTSPSDFVEYIGFQKVVDPESTRIRVMTIHQAKGLEFDIVILPELEIPVPGQADLYAAGRDTKTGPITTVCMQRNKAIRSLLPQSILRIFEQSRAQDLSESLCVLYVAVTRAIRALHLIVAPSSPNERYLSKSYSGLIRAAWVGQNPLPEQSLIYQIGNENWHLDSSVKDVSPSRDSDQELQIKLPASSLKSSRGFQSISPSQLEGGSKEKVAGVFQHERSAAMAYGTLIHAWFEEIEWLENGIPDEQRLRRIARQNRIANLDLDTAIQSFQQMLEHESIASILLRSEYLSNNALPQAKTFQEIPEGSLDLEVRQEEPITALVNNNVITGNIDRLVLMRQAGTLLAADVIDYKTDSLTPSKPERIEEKTAFYQPQLEAYCDAVSHMFNLKREKIAAKLIFTNLGVVKNIDL